MVRTSHERSGVGTSAPAASSAAWLAAALALAAALSLSAGPAEAADPFYDQRLRDGIRAWDRGDAAAAIDELRIACFGLLDEPPLLARGLAFLALAQDAEGDGDGFARTLGRLAGLESAFGAYAQAGLDDSIRRALRQAAAPRLTAAELAASPLFATIEAPGPHRENGG